MPTFLDQNIVVGNDEDFRIEAEKDGTPWDITGGTVLLYLRDPSGNWSTAYTATVSDGPNGVAHYQAGETVLDEAGYWAQQWEVTKSGITLRTEVFDFYVGPFRPGYVVV